MTDISDHYLYSIGEQAVADNAPAGTSARYEPEFEQLEAELARQESLNAETVDWGKVVELSALVIREKSKDLLVAAYLTRGLLETEGYSGFAVGLKTINDMIEHHWDGMSPPLKRLRARATAIQWLAEKCGPIIEAKEPADDQAGAIKLADAMARQIDGELIDRMGDSAPSMMEMNRHLKRYKQIITQQAATPPATPAPDAPAKPASDDAPVKAAPATIPQNTTRPSASPAKPVTIGDIASDNDAKKGVRQLQEGGRKTAAYWISSKLSDPRPYRLNRSLVWLLLDQAPPNTEGVTQLNPPAADRLKFFSAQLEAKQYSGVIPELEQTLARAAFWLDGQRLVVNALQALGPEYEAACHAIMAELRNLLARIPTLVDLKFSDGTPFADDQTRMWLENELSAQATSEGDAAAGEAAPWSETLKEAKSMAASGDIKPAISLMKKNASATSNVREQHFWRLSLADLLLQTGNLDVAIPTLEQLGNHLDDKNLSTWEPGLMSQTYKLLCDGYQKQINKLKNTKDKHTELDIILAKREQAYAQLCWHDPLSATHTPGDK
ncbi:MAG: type VI secretion system protein TssA [Gammaproteobacteria bacterium]|nr:type VI secretion system protein TssA [Gammaproteobacteria bacterium]